MSRLQTRNPDTPNHYTLEVSIDPNESIADLKKRITSMLDIESNPRYQQLILKEKKRGDEEKVGGIVEEGEEGEVYLVVG